MDLDRSPSLKLGAGLTLLAILLAAGLTAAGCQSDSSDSDFQSGNGEDKDSTTVVILATTTSTYDSGLLDVLVPVFEDKTGFIVKSIAVGTGHALKMGARGDADVLLVHSPAAEKILVDDGDAVDRKLVMHNDFVLVGPHDDPAAVGGLNLVHESFSQIANTSSIFVSRGDESGTHKRELAAWDEAELSPSGAWYLESGQGMGATLRIASEKRAYTLTDRATYLALLDTLDLKILLEGDPSLINPYHVMLVNPEKWPAVNRQGAKAWSDFLLSPEGQALIEQFGKSDFGMPLFIPDAGKSENQLGEQ